MYVWHIASSKWGNNNKERGKGFFVVVYLKAHRLQTCDYLGGSNIQFVANVPSFLASKLKLVSGLEAKGKVASTAIGLGTRDSLVWPGQSSDWFGVAGLQP